MDFDQATEEYIAAIREHKLAHAEAVQSTAPEVNLRYLQACERVEKAGERWRKLWPQSRN